jgi:transposase
MRRDVEAREYRDATIARAVESGMSLRQVAAITGLSFARVHQIVRARRGA